MSTDPKTTVRQVFDEHARYIWRTLRHLGIADADAPDLCQEVFITVSRKLSSFEGRSTLRTWLYGICIRVVSEHRRRPYVRHERPASEPTPPDANASEALPDTQLEQRSAVQRLLGALDEDKRLVVVLYEIEGFSMKEVAELVGCPLQTAYSRLHAGRELMLAALTADTEGDS
ncbi:MAG TPA: RNA polymerase sigma factor [Polyangiaceae bacterium]|jgi:RNA polymerase sigma-70 factor (ECF subfamily)|nr:RNA polymerase sigma factor [Polyangiaceae bacterium]